MTSCKIFLTGIRGSACLTFIYENWAFIGETELSGDPDIVNVLSKNLSLPQVAGLSRRYPAPVSKGYDHAFAAARATANELGLNLETAGSPVYPPPGAVDLEYYYRDPEIDDPYSDDEVLEMFNFSNIISRSAFNDSISRSNLK